MGIIEIIKQDLYEEGIEKGLDKKTTSIIKKMLIKHPEWDNELIADLADTTVEKVAEVRASLKKEK